MRLASVVLILLALEMSALAGHVGMKLHETGETTFAIEGQGQGGIHAFHGQEETLVKWTGTDGYKARLAVDEGMFHHHLAFLEIFHDNRGHFGEELWVGHPGHQHLIFGEGHCFSFDRGTGVELRNNFPPLSSLPSEWLNPPTGGSGGNPTPQGTPEPASILLMATGLLFAFGYCARRRSPR